MSLETIDLSILDVQPKDLILDVGCGVGRHTISVALHTEVTAIGLDISRQDLQTARQRWEEFGVAGACHFIRSSALKLPFEDHAFDKIICSEVLEHIDDYPAVLAELYRVLKPGGRLAVSVPRFIPEWICWQLSEAYHNVPGGHIRIFRSSTLKQAVEKLGLHRTHRHWAHALHVPYWWLRCAFWRQGDQAWAPRTYHKLLVWDLLSQPRLTRVAERLLNPLMGKSIVMYFTRP